jgi:hypothetical protein
MNIIFFTDSNLVVITQIIYSILLQIIFHKNEGDDIINHMKRDGALLIFVMVLSLCLCVAVSAHPGHGTPIEEPSDSGTGSTDIGTTDTGSTGSTTTGTSSRGSSGSSPASTSSGYTARSSSSTSGAQSDETTANPTGSTENTATQTGNSPEYVTDTGSSSNSPGGPIAMIGLMVVIGLIAMSFPYKEGGAIRNLQLSLFGR